jgi:hypothetical protein
MERCGGLPGKHEDLTDAVAAKLAGRGRGRGGAAYGQQNAVQLTSHGGGRALAATRTEDVPLSKPAARVAPRVSWPCSA